MIDTRIRNFAEGPPLTFAPPISKTCGLRLNTVARASPGNSSGMSNNGPVAEALDWLGSDARLDNDTSHAWHKANGFQEVENWSYSASVWTEERLHRARHRW